MAIDSRNINTLAPKKRSGNVLRMTVYDLLSRLAGRTGREEIIDALSGCLQFSADRKRPSLALQVKKV